MRERTYPYPHPVLRRWGWDGGHVRVSVLYGCYIRLPVDITLQITFDTINKNIDSTKRKRNKKNVPHNALYQNCSNRFALQRKKVARVKKRTYFEQLAQFQNYLNSTCSSECTPPKLLKRLCLVEKIANRPRH